jgi:hypothetical protein
VIGRHAKEIDMPSGAPGRPGYDAQTKFGAGALYDDDVGFAWVHATLTRPAIATARNVRWNQMSKVSNRVSEHNIFNMPVRIVVAQLAPQTLPSNLKNLVSRRLVLRPGNQSLGGT